MDLSISTRGLLVRGLVALLLGIAVSFPIAYLLLAPATGVEPGSQGSAGYGVTPVRVGPGYTDVEELGRGGAGDFIVLERLIDVIASARSYGAPLYDVYGPVVRPLMATITAAAVPEAQAVGGGASVIGTNVQVEGVDEGDIADISSDGRLVAVARGGEVLVHDIVGGGAPESIAGPGGEAVALSFIDNRLLAIVWDGLRGSEPGLLPRHVELWLVSLENPREPGVVERHRVSGSYIALRVDGGVVLLVTDTTPGPGEKGLPWLDNKPLTDDSLAALDPLPLSVIQVTLMKPGEAAESIVVAAGLNVRVVAGYGTIALAWTTPYDPSLLESLLKESAVAAGARAERIVEALEEGTTPVVVALGDEWLNRKDLLNTLIDKLAAGLEERPGPYTSVAFISYEDGLRVLGKTVVRGALLDQLALHPLGDGLYVVATTVMMQGRIVTVSWDAPVTPQPDEVTIVVRKGDYREAITVTPGVEEGDGVGSVYTLIYSMIYYEGAAYNSVYVAAVDGSVVGSLEGFGEGLRLRAARLVGSIMYVSAYTVKDPVYAVDLSDPREPRLLGELKMPGWSEYLHPLNEELLIGVGFTDDGRNKLVLIDVSDPLDPKLVDELVLEGVRVYAARDEYHAFTYDPETGRVYLVARGPIGSLGVLAVDVSTDGLELAKFIEAPGALRVFAAGDRLVVAARDYVVLYDRETLEPLLRALGS